MQPHLIQPRTDGVLGFAAIAAWNEEMNLLTTAIITVPAAASIRGIHHRMPAVLRPSAHAAWLDVETEEPAALLDEVVSDFDHVEVSRAVNSARYTGAVDPINPA